MPEPLHAFMQGIPNMGASGIADAIKEVHGWEIFGFLRLEPITYWDFDKDARLSS